LLKINFHRAVACFAAPLRQQQRNEIMKNFRTPVKLFFKIIFQQLRNSRLTHCFPQPAGTAVALERAHYRCNKEKSKRNLKLNESQQSKTGTQNNQPEGM
ncbi:MAG: hypothetical protein LWW81_11565, partial [Rhodocyclales bacterium]|nr:hypothetical protein [Rhodocyclales bacterium]